MGKFVEPKFNHYRERLKSLSNELCTTAMDEPDCLPMLLTSVLAELAEYHCFAAILTSLREVGQSENVRNAVAEQVAEEVSDGYPVAKLERMAVNLAYLDEIVKAYRVARPDGRRHCAMTTMMRVCGLPSSRRFAEQVSSFLKRVYLPLSSYLEDCLYATDDLLALLWQYKRLVEWFDQGELVGLDEKQHERHLSRFLMAHGVPYPFNQPHIPEARPDIVLPFEKQPLPLEIKLYDGSNKDRAYIRTGFGQATDYAEKYQSPFGYYVVYNHSVEGRLQFGESTDSVPALTAHNKVIFCIPIQVARLGAPSGGDGPHNILFPTQFLTNAMV